MRKAKRARPDGKRLIIFPVISSNQIKSTFADIDAEGMHVDVHVSDISSASEDETTPKKNKDPTADLKHFFSEVPCRAGDKKQHVKCNCCE